MRRLLLDSYRFPGLWACVIVRWDFLTRRLANPQARAALQKEWGRLRACGKDGCWGEKWDIHEKHTERLELRPTSGGCVWQLRVEAHTSISQRVHRGTTSGRHGSRCRRPSWSSRCCARKRRSQPRAFQRLRRRLLGHGQIGTDNQTRRLSEWRLRSLSAARL